MRFFHLSDLHIGKQLNQYSLIEDQTAILDQIVDLVRIHRPEAVVIAGDIYDKPVPPAEAVSVFNCFLTALAGLEEGPEIFVIAGNHDSAERLNFASALLAKQRVHIAALPPEPGQYLTCIRITDAYGAVDFHLMPFIKPPYIRRLFDQGAEPKTYDAAVRALLEREKLDETARHVLVAHQFFTKAGKNIETCDSEILQVGGLDQVDVSAAEGFDYGAFGHIHGMQCIDAGFYYCGSPLKYSVSETGQQKVLLMVELKEKGSSPILTKLPLKPLRDVRLLRGSLTDILQRAKEGGTEDYVSVILTDEQEIPDAREQLLDVFPQLLEVQVDNTRTRQQLTESFETDMLLSPEEIFDRFFEGIQGRTLTDKERELMQRVINRSREEAGE